MNRISVATIDAPEFVNITSINPMISKCEVKVLYIGQNRNRSYITKEVATQMAQTLPGCPIVGYYIENKEDFGDHGDQMIIDGEGIKFNKLTKPYGFVAPDSKIWFQKFEDTDEFGNKTVREYLMTEGYLWTGQFEECQRVIEEGNPQSMELDEKTLKGHWSTDVNRGIEFFIINDAIFSKLCILGEDVEPCFEGAAVTAPEVSSNFSRNDDFSKTLFNMVQELKELTFSLKDKGGISMAQENVNTEFTEENAAPVAESNEDATLVENTENFSTEEGKVDSENTVESDTNVEEFAKKEEDSSENKKEEEDTTAEDDNKDDEEKELKTKNSLEEKFALVEAELSELKVNYEKLQKENEELVNFKNAVEDEKKTNLIKSFYMLSDDDKKDVIDNKAKYSLDEIEAKLSVICVRKKVNFNVEEDSNSEEQPAVTYNLHDMEADTLPAWLKAVESHRNTNN